VDTGWEIIFYDRKPDLRLVGAGSRISGLLPEARGSWPPMAVVTNELAVN